MTWTQDGFLDMRRSFAALCLSLQPFVTWVGERVRLHSIFYRNKDTLHSLCNENQGMHSSPLSLFVFIMLYCHWSTSCFLFLLYFCWYFESVNTLWGHYWLFLRIVFLTFLFLLIKGFSLKRLEGYDYSCLLLGFSLNSQPWDPVGYGISSSSFFSQHFFSFFSLA